MTTTTHLALSPRDGFFCKDGRGWCGDGGGFGHGLAWPWPSTVRGAVRTLWGRAHEAEVRERSWPIATQGISLGRTLALWREHGTTGPDALDRRWPVAADVEYVRSADDAPGALPRVCFLYPEPGTVANIATLGRDDDRARERLWIARADDRSKPGPRPRWWSEAELCAWLAGVAPSSEPAVANDRPVRRRVTRVAIGPTTQTAIDSALFSHDVVETVERKGEWSIAAEVIAPDARFADLATLGSDRRLARVSKIGSRVFDAPSALATASDAGSRGLRLLVVTPAIFAGGWLPDGLTAYGETLRGHLAGLAPEVVLRAAITSRPVAISGWDMAAAAGRGAPRRTDLAVAPGAVYFFERFDGGTFTAAQFTALWLAALGSRVDDGFGRVVAAPWDPASRAGR
jgi:CRISPR-associated protein Cmr3